MEFTREEKRGILKNEQDYPELARIIKAKNRFEFEKGMEMRT